MGVVRFALRLIGVVLLAVFLSAAWLFRENIAGALGHHGDGSTVAAHPTPKALGRARDKVDSLNGWHADSVMLTATEMASLLEAGLPRDALTHFDSVGVTLGEGRVGISGRLDTSVIPKESLGPLAGVLSHWEPVAASGTVAMIEPGVAEWRVDRLTLRGITFPETVSRAMVQRAFSGSAGSGIRIALPKGISALHVHPNGVALFPVAPR
jgi:hypothetical protein